MRYENSNIETVRTSYTGWSFWIALERDGVFSLWLNVIKRKSNTWNDKIKDNSSFAWFITDTVFLKTVLIILYYLDSGWLSPLMKHNQKSLKAVFHITLKSKSRFDRVCLAPHQQVKHQRVNMHLLGPSGSHQWVGLAFLRWWSGLTSAVLQLVQPLFWRVISAKSHLL